MAGREHPKIIEDKLSIEDQYLQRNPQNTLVAHGRDKLDRTGQSHRKLLTVIKNVNEELPSRKEVLKTISSTLEGEGKKQIDLLKKAQEVQRLSKQLSKDIKALQRVNEVEGLQKEGLKRKIEARDAIKKGKPVAEQVAEKAKTKKPSEDIDRGRKLSIKRATSRVKQTQIQVASEAVGRHKKKGLI